MISFNFYMVKTNRHKMGKEEICGVLESSRGLEPKYMRTAALEQFHKGFTNASKA